jgi:predicted anti-sigma-YlaC factor YlaD
MDNKCKELELQIQALSDGETETFSDEDLSNIFSHLSDCRECRSKYSSTMQLKIAIKAKVDNPLPKEWFEQLEKKRSNKIMRRLGYFLVFIPYIILIGVGLNKLFNDSGENIIIKFSIATIILGFLILFTITIAERIKEYKTDKYKEIMK